MDQVLITKEGLEKLKKELQELKEIEVPAVIKRIQNARDAGDLSENADYDKAKNDQARIEGRIQELEDVIKNAQIANSAANGTVTVGTKVRVHIDGNEEEFYIVGAVEADPTNKKISHESPFGASLLNKKVGDKIEVEAPMGKLTYTILAIE